MTDLSLLILILLVLTIVGIIVKASLHYQIPFVRIQPKVVNHKKFLGTRQNSKDIYKTINHTTNIFYSPFSLTIDHRERIVLMDFKDDHEYNFIELQILEEDNHEKFVVFLCGDNFMDIYHSSGFIISQETHQLYFVFKNNVRSINEAALDYSFKFNDGKIEGYVSFKDKNGRHIKFTFKENSQKKPTDLTVPVYRDDDKNTGINFFPIWFAKKINFLRPRASDISLTIDGIKKKPIFIPFPINWSFVYLTRYSIEPVFGIWNEEYSGPLTPITSGSDSQVQHKNINYELVWNKNHPEIRAINTANQRNSITIEFSPAIPDLVQLKDNLELKGRFSIGVYNTLGIIAGDYCIRTSSPNVNIDIFPNKAYQPFPGKIWVKLFKWTAKISTKDQNNVFLTSTWTTSNT